MPFFPRRGATQSLVLAFNTALILLATLLTYLQPFVSVLMTIHQLRASESHNALSNQIPTWKMNLNLTICLEKATNTRDLEKSQTSNNSDSSRQWLPEPIQLLLDLHGLLKSLTGQTASFILTLPYLDESTKTQMVDRITATKSRLLIMVSLLILFTVLSLIFSKIRGKGTVMASPDDQPEPFDRHGQPTTKDVQELDGSIAQEKPTAHVIDAAAVASESDRSPTLVSRHKSDDDNQEEEQEAQDLGDCYQNTLANPLGRRNAWDWTAMPGGEPITPRRFMLAFQTRESTALVSPLDATYNIPFSTVNYSRRRATIPSHA
jgi:hypothetical protein